MSNPDQVYYNVSLRCLKTNPTDADMPCRYSETRQTPLITNAQGYEVALIRASIDATTIPAFIPKIVPNQSNVNLTSYVIKIVLLGSANNGTGMQNLIYDCKSQYYSNVPAVAGADSNYYYSYNLQDICDMFNSAVSACYSEIGGTINTKKPIMNYSNNLFSVMFDSNGFGGADATSSGGSQERLRIYINEDLKNLLRNLNLSYVPDPTDNVNYEILISNKISNNVTVGSTLYYNETQNYPSTSTISPVSSIVFISNMGARYEYLGTTQILNNYSIGSSQSDNIENQIIDISLPLDNSNDYNTQIAYTASIFRFSDIICPEIRNIDLNIFWKSKNGINYPLLLSDGCGMSCKFLFRKK